MRALFAFSLIFLFVVIGAWPAHAQSRLTGFDLLRLTPSARSAALSNAVNASGPDGLFLNPAFLDEDGHDQMSLGYLNHLDDIWLGFASYVREAPKIGGTMGVAIRHLGYGEFDRTDFDGNVLGTFGASETALTIAYSRPVAERLLVGGAVHTAFVGVADYSAAALAVDVGASYELSSDGRTIVSAALRNVGLTASSLGADPAVVPTDLRVTVSHRLQNVPLRLTLTGYDLTRFEGENGSALNEIARHLAFSGEFLFGTAFAVRAGYDYRLGEELSTGERLDLAGVGMGFGLNLRRFGFDYSYNAWSSFGGLHHVTLRTRL